MIKELRDRLKQTKPFANVEEEVALAIQALADDHWAVVDRVLKAGDLTTTQYNVLRILRGAGEEGLSCRDIGERMVTRDPDITRILDRLEGRELIRRERQSADRRVILAFITEIGLALLRELDGPIATTQKEIFNTLTEGELETFSQLLEKMLRGAKTITSKGGKQ